MKKCPTGSKWRRGASIAFRDGLVATALLRRILLATVFANLLISIQSASFAQTEDSRIAACFEGVTRTLADSAQAKDDLTRHLAEMGAARACNERAAEVIRACVTEAGASNGDMKDYQTCIGTVANPCIDSPFGSTEFRKVICIGTEEQVWLDLVRENFAALKAGLSEKSKARIEDTEKAFFNYRDLKCGLVRTVFEGDEPDVAYGVCTTETAARFAIDLNELKAKILAK